MKLGDTLTCKKKIRFTGPELIIDIGYKYIIYNITDYYVELLKNSDVVIFKLHEDNIYMNGDDIHFRKYAHLNYIWEYFYTQEEIRIKKLDSL